MNAIFAILTAAAAVGDGDAARAHLATLPVDRQPYARYITTAPLDSDEARDSCAIALRLVIPSMSRQPILERCLPTQVAPTLFHIDLAELQWSNEAWRDLVQRYPYNPTGAKDSLTVRGDWLLVNLTDAVESGAYLPLVFGKRPATRDEALAILGVDGAAQHRFGLIEGQSGVSKQGTRWIENRPVARGYAYGTADTLKLDGERDPLESPEAIGKHDGEEWIIGIQKLHLATGTRGVLQVYFLANGQGAIVDRAPVDLVEDSTEFRGLREIRTAGSCINCHDRGLNYPTVNALRQSLEAGVELYADHETQQAIEAFHLSDLGKELKRDNEDFQAMVKLATGQTAPAAVAYFQSAVSRYDEPVSLERAAAECYATPEQMKLALAWRSSQGYQLGARAAGLAEGLPIPRAAMEENAFALRSIVDAWKATE